MQNKIKTDYLDQGSLFAGLSHYCDLAQATLPWAA